MKIFVVDITGRNASQYNPSLCKALFEEDSSNSVILCSPTLYKKPEGFDWLKLLSLVPNSMTSSSSIYKRILRALETILNYFYIAIKVFLSKPDIIHFQWLPLVEFTNIEPFFLKLVYVAYPKARIAMTVHNLYPHESSEIQRQQYKKRFAKVQKYINMYFVHLDNTKAQFVKEFCVSEDVVFVAYHGIYEADKQHKTSSKSSKNHFNIIMYGYQTPYKGADLLLEALKLMPANERKFFKCKIVGRTDPDLYERCIGEAKQLEVEWVNRFVSDDELYSAIGESDLILLPYRMITQSGVLLLALSYRKPIITSDLISFKETLEGYPEDYFFERGNAESLCKLLRRFVAGEIDIDDQIKIIERLNEKYSWKNTAKSTLNAYKKQVYK